MQTPRRQPRPVEFAEYVPPVAVPSVLIPPKPLDFNPLPAENTPKSTFSSSITNLHRDTEDSGRHGLGLKYFPSQDSYDSSTLSTSTNDLVPKYTSKIEEKEVLLF